MEEQLKKYILKKYGSIRNFSIQADIPYTTFVTILQRGIYKSNVSNMIKVCKKLNISLEELVENNKIVEKEFGNEIK